MAWKEQLHPKNEIKKSYLSVDRDGMITLASQMRGANKGPYSREYINHALKQLGITWDKANMNTSDAELLEIYLNRGNSGYAYNQQQRTNIMRNAGAPFLKKSSHLEQLKKDSARVAPDTDDDVMDEQQQQGFQFDRKVVSGQTSGAAVGQYKELTEEILQLAAQARKDASKQRVTLGIIRGMIKEAGIPPRDK